MGLQRRISSLNQHRDTAAFLTIRFRHAVAATALRACACFFLLSLPIQHRCGICPSRWLRATTRSSWANRAPGRPLSSEPSRVRAAVLTCAPACGRGLLASDACTVSQNCGAATAACRDSSPPPDDGGCRAPSRLQGSGRRAMAPSAPSPAGPRLSSSFHRDRTWRVPQVLFFSSSSYSQPALVTPGVASPVAVPSLIILFLFHFSRLPSSLRRFWARSGSSCSTPLG